MASYTVRIAKHATLTTTTADLISLNGGLIGFEVVNKDASNAVYFTWTDDGSTPTTAVAAADDTDYVAAAGGSKLVMCTPAGGVGIKVSVVGNGGAYSVVGVVAT
jgi:hypothetical protein